MDKVIHCPECGLECDFIAVMLTGNFVTGEAKHPIARFDCPECNVIVGVDCDQEWGWQQWVAQGNKRDE